LKLGIVIGYLGDADGADEIKESEEHQRRRVITGLNE
jgi:hypothetical protein